MRWCWSIVVELIGLDVYDVAISLGVSGLDELLRRSSWSVCCSQDSVVVDVHLGCPNNLVSDCLLHDVDLRLPDDLHQLVLKRDRELVGSLNLIPLVASTLELLEPKGSSTLSDTSSFNRGVDQEWIVLD